MKTPIILFAVFLVATVAFGNADTLHIELIDSLDAPTGHDFWHEPVDLWPAGYNYCGTQFWDLAMGDSFMVWLPGNRSIKYINPYDSTQIDTFFTDSGFVSANLIGCAIDSVRYFVVGDGFVFAFDFRTTYARYWSYMHTPGANYYFLALEDSFLYTMGHPGIACINVANPESIFVYKSYEDAGASTGLEVLDGYTYSATTYSQYNEVTEEVYPCFRISKVDMINSPTPVPVYSGGIFRTQKFFGGITTDDTYLYYVNTSMTDYPDWTIGESYFRILGTDTSYTFESHWDGQGVFCVEAIDTHLFAAGFERGVSVLNVSNLDSIYEAAYYIDPDSEMNITHLALKEDRLYAMGHPRDGYATLYMFRLDDSVVHGINELSPSKPDAITISAYPNPFNSAVRISVEQTFLSVQNGQTGVFDLPISVEIYDLNGRRIAQLPSPSIPLPGGEGGNSFSLWEKVAEGRMRAFTWQPSPSLPSGVYLIRATAGGCERTARVVYLK